MNSKKLLITLVSAIALATLLPTACGSQTSISVPTQPLLAPQPKPIGPSILEATVNCDPDIHAYSSADIVGVWSGITQPTGSKTNMEFMQAGNYSIKISEGEHIGYMLDNGKFWFEGAQLKIQGDALCLNPKGDAFECVGIYEACVTKQGGQPTQLRLVAVEDKYTGRKSDLTRAPMPIVQP